MFQVIHAAGAACSVVPLGRSTGPARYHDAGAWFSRASLLFLPEQELARDDSGQAWRPGFTARAFCFGPANSDRRGDDVLAGLLS